MKKYLILKIIVFHIIITFYVINPTHGQYCDKFYETKNCLILADASFHPYGQSKSAMLEINKSFECKLVLYGEKDFKIAVCTENGYSPVHYKILNARTRNVLYDNITDDYNESVGFTNDYTQSIIIEITVLAEAVEPKDIYDKRVCVGINILWRKAPKLGF